MLSLVTTAMPDWRSDIALGRGAQTALKRRLYSAQNGAHTALRMVLIKPSDSAQERRSEWRLDSAQNGAHTGLTTGAHTSLI